MKGAICRCDQNSTIGVSKSDSKCAKIFNPLIHREAESKVSRNVLNLIKLCMESEQSVLFCSSFCELVNMPVLRTANRALNTSAYECMSTLCGSAFDSNAVQTELQSALASSCTFFNDITIVSSSSVDNDEGVSILTACVLMLLIFTVGLLLGYLYARVK